MYNLYIHNNPFMSFYSFEEATDEGFTQYALLGNCKKSDINIIEETSFIHTIWGN